MKVNKQIMWLFLFLAIAITTTSGAYAYNQALFATDYTMFPSNMSDPKIFNIANLSNNGTIYGTYTHNKTLPLGAATNFSQQARIQSTNGINGSGTLFTSYTIAGWFNLTNTTSMGASTNNALFGDAGGNTAVAIGVYAGGGTIRRLTVSYGNVNFNNNTADLVPGTAYHFAVVTDKTPSQNRSYIYINGVLQSNASFTAANAVVSGLTYWGCVGNGTSCVNGTVMNDLLFYYGALNSSDVGYIYNNGSGCDPIITNCSMSPSTYFSINATNNYTGATINTFNANVTINGTTANYGTTNGTINFNFTQGSILVNISVNTTGPGLFFTNQTFNWNTSTNYASMLIPWANVTARDLYDGSSITSFTVQDNTTNYSTTNGYVQIPEMGLYNATVFASNYFNGVLLNVNATGTQNATLFQAQVTFNATELISLLNVTSFTVSNNSILNSNGTGSTAPVLFLKAGNYNITFNKSGYYNITYPIVVTALQNNTQNLSGVYRYVLNVSVRDYILGTTLTSYSVNITSGLYPTYIANVNTTNGSALFPWINDTNINITVYNSSVATVSILYNTSNFSSIAPAIVNITLFSATTNSITFVFRDEQTGVLINNITAFLTGIYSSYNLSTTNGTIFQSLITPDIYTISYYNTQNQYVPRTYFYNLTNGSTTTLTLYLLMNASATIVQINVIDLATFVAVPNETIQLLKKNLSSTSYYIVDECKTDRNGQCLVSAEVASTTYKTNTIYRILAYSELTLNFDLGDTQLATNTLTFQINRQTDLLKQYFQLNSFSSSLTNGTDYFQYVWSDSLGNVNTACLQVYRVSKGSYTLVNQSCTVASSGTINLTGLDLTKGNSYYAQASVIYDTTQPAYMTDDDTIYLPNQASLGGVGSLIVGAGVILTGTLAFAPYLPGMIAFTALGIYVMAVPNVVTIQQTAMVLIIILLGFFLLRSKT